TDPGPVTKGHGLSLGLTTPICKNEPVTETNTRGIVGKVMLMVAAEGPTQPLDRRPTPHPSPCDQSLHLCSNCARPRGRRAPGEEAPGGFTCGGLRAAAQEEPGNSYKKTWTRGHVTGACGGRFTFQHDGDPKRPAKSEVVWGQVSGVAQSKPQTR
ncbi:unnamed protein product, partial [Pleuronectes platessa]